MITELVPIIIDYNQLNQLPAAAGVFPLFVCWLLQFAVDDNSNQNTAPLENIINSESNQRIRYQVCLPPHTAEEHCMSSSPDLKLVTVKYPGGAFLWCLCYEGCATQTSACVIHLLTAHVRD